MRRLARHKKATLRKKAKGLTDKDLHCFARIMQSIMFAPKEYNEDGISYDCNPLLR